MSQLLGWVVNFTAAPVVAINSKQLHCARKYTRSKKMKY